MPHSVPGSSPPTKFRTRTRYEPFARINGVARAETDGRYLLNSFEKMISYVSQGESLHPGEVIGSGTFTNGSGLEIDPLLNEGDVVELEFEKIGVLRNPIVSPV
jgi:2-keto-4-pentenoate hydratase/2-oxohepta-3-ene-1,7-dioic acid hydratase in catechol pathway